MRQTDLLDLMESRRDQMQVVVETPTEKVDVNAWDELLIDQLDLDTEFAAIPGQIAYWVAVAARYRIVVESFRVDFDNWFAPKYEQEFLAYQSETGKKPNISTAENRVRMKYKEEHDRLRLQLVESEANLKIVEGMVTALEAKLQALIQIAKRRNIEYDRTESDHLMGRGAVPYSSPAPPQRAQSRGSKTGEVQTDMAKDILRNMVKGGSGK